MMKREEGEQPPEERHVLRIRNLHCANCALEMQEELAEIDGVTSAQVDFLNQKVTLSCTTEAAYKACIRLITHFDRVEIVEGAPPRAERHTAEIVSLCAAAVFFLPALILQLVGGSFKWLIFGLYFASFAAAGWQVVLSFFKNVFSAFREGFRLSLLLDENTLMLIAAVGAFALGETMEGAAVMLLYQLGELLQALAVGSSRDAIGKLLEMKSESCILLKGGSQREVSPEELTAGDEILLRRGDKVPADCKLLSGSQFDTKSLTGEAYLRDCAAGEEVLAGFVNEGNAVQAEVLRPASESAVAKILDMVENAASQKAAPEKFITRFARVYTPVVVLLALCIAVIPPLFDGFDFAGWIMTALNLLVISCPCALVISVPLTYFSGVGSLARIGVLAKGAVYLDALARVKVAAFDKTGTLTKGKFSVARTHGQERALAIAAALERKSSHPLARAFDGIPSAFLAENCTEIAGMGLAAEVGSKQVLVGSERLMRERGISVTPLKTSASVVYVAEEGEPIGSIEIEDAVREDAAAALSALKREGVRRTVMLTGDTPDRAEAVVKDLPVDEVYAGLLPMQKPERAAALKAEGALLYVGDGINDTPVMTVSDVAVSMGKLGSDAAIEASDLVLVSDSLSALPKALRTAKKTRRIVFENIAFSIAVKAAFMILSLLHLMPLWLAVFADVGVMLLAVLNSLRMRAKIR